KLAVPPLMVSTCPRLATGEVKLTVVANGPTVVPPLILLCQFRMGRKTGMRSRSLNRGCRSLPWRRACSSSQSPMRRCTSGSGRRRRSGRGGKSPTGTSPQAYLLPVLPFLFDQEAVRQHHQHTVAVEPRPQPALVLVPAQQFLGLLVELFHSPAP